MDNNENIELDGALGLLSDAGLAFTLVERCPSGSCGWCREDPGTALPAAA